MADLTRKRLTELRAEFAGVLELTGKPDERLSVSLEEGLALLSMASRSVSEETLRKLAAYVEIAADHTNERERQRELAWAGFSREAFRDLRSALTTEAAEALAKEGPVDAPP
jgi:hypothetical protein